jgi:outer membrane protein assembly factor BamC
MALGFDRAWSELLYEIGESFDGEGRQLLDQNRSSGEILVEYTPRDSGGILGMFGGDPQSRRYRLQVDEPAQDATRVRVTGENGGTLEEGEARELLDTLASALR